MTTFVDPPPTPYQRASNWVHFGVYDVEQVLGREACPSATENGLIWDYTNNTQIGTWRMAGDDLVIEIKE
jgi:hypothetical protein